MNPLVIRQVFLNCKKDPKKTIEKLITIEIDIHGGTADQARIKVGVIIKKIAAMRGGADRFFRIIPPRRMTK